MIRKIDNGGLKGNELYIDEAGSAGLRTSRIRTGWKLYLKRLGKTDPMDRVAEYDIYRLMKEIKKQDEQEKIVARLGNLISSDQAFTLLMFGKITSKKAETSLLKKINNSLAAIELLKVRSFSEIYELNLDEFPVFFDLAQNISIDSLDKLVNKQTPNRDFVRCAIKNVVNRLAPNDCATAVRIGIYAYEYPAWNQFENEIMKPAVTLLSQFGNKDKIYAEVCDIQVRNILVMLVDYPSNAGLNAAKIYFKDIESVDGAERMLNILTEYVQKCPINDKGNGNTKVRDYLAERVSEIAKNTQSNNNT